MHVQRVILLTPALLGLAATGLAILGVLPWVSFSFHVPQELIAKSVEGPIFQWKIRMDLISLACFAMAGAMCAFGGIAKPMSWLGRLVVFVLSIVPLTAGWIILMNYSTTVIRLFGFVGSQAEMFWPGFGTWLMSGAALVLLLSSILAGRFGRVRPAKVADAKQAEEVQA